MYICKECKSMHVYSLSTESDITVFSDIYALNHGDEQELTSCDLPDFTFYYCHDCKDIVDVEYTKDIVQNKKG